MAALTLVPSKVQKLDVWISHFAHPDGHPMTITLYMDADGTCRAEGIVPAALVPPKPAEDDDESYLLCPVHP